MPTNDETVVSLANLQRAIYNLNDHINYLLQLKQDLLVSGTNLKSVNSESLVGAGNLTTTEDLQIVAGTTVPYSTISSFKFIVVYGYKAGIDSPNQTCFVIIPSAMTKGEENIRISARAGSSNWQYGIIVKYGAAENPSDENVYFYTDVDYSGNTQFIVTKMIGAK